MEFRHTPLQGAYLLVPERHEDERGSFFRSFCQREFEAHGLDPTIAQANVSTNRHAGTLRGLHFQLGPHGETKLVRCTRGRLFDAIVDLRPASTTFGQAYTVELTASNGYQLYIPRGFAHGFLTLEEDTEISYLMGNFYQPGSAAGIRWDDPRIGIAWPSAPAVLSERDAGLPLLEQIDLEALRAPISPTGEPHLTSPS